MIQLLRVDDKLLHGQIAFSWVRNLHIHTIIVADDRAAHDEFSKMTLGLSKPAGVNLLIMDVESAIDALQQHEESKIHVMAIVNSVENAQRIMLQVKSLRSLNIGVLREHYQSKTYTPTVALNPSELDICQTLIQQGYELELRLRYDDPRILLKDVINHEY